MSTGSPVANSRPTRLAWDDTKTQLGKFLDAQHELAVRFVHQSNEVARSSFFINVRVGESHALGIVRGFIFDYRDRLSFDPERPMSTSAI